MIEFRTSGPSLADSDIDDLEGEVGGAIPASYRRFLLASNGGTPTVRLEFPKGDGRTELAWFYELLPGSQRGIRYMLSNLVELGATGILPIAHSLNEAEVCIRLRDGHVLLSPTYAIQMRLMREGATLQFEPLTGTFSAFLASIVEVATPNCRVQELGKSGGKIDLEGYLAQGNSIDLQGIKQRTILGEAIKHRNHEMLDACIARGADLTGSAILATKNQRHDVILKLLEAGVNINERDKHGKRALDYVGGTKLPGERGAKNRELRDFLISLGAKKGTE